MDSISKQTWISGSLSSEDGILGMIGRHFVNSHPHLLLARGDDCAVFKENGNLCVSSDLFLEDIHFRKAYFDPDEIGHKALAVNISDLAAMGARPIAFTLCLGLPEWVDMPWLDLFFSGMSRLASKYRMGLAGGDLSRSPALHISITVFGECPEGSSFLTRGGSMPGDCLFVVGQIGLARIGLHELEERGRDALADWPESCAAHLSPEPQVGAGLMLARAGFNARPPALMDLSDGLLRDLPRLLGLNGELGAPSPTLGANMVLSPSLLHPEVVAHAGKNGQDPLMEAIAGGEDYALLGTCAPDMRGVLHSAIPGFMCIGEVTDTGKIMCNGKPLDGLAGFDHFDDGRHAG